MPTYHGSCHCGAVRYEIDSEIKRVTRCTCSVCRKKGVLLHRVDPANLRVMQGEDKLKLYQFNKKVAKHYFCADCGIHVFGNPRAAPDMFVVNVNTLDDYDVEKEKPPLRIFDGRNWEQAMGQNPPR